MSTNFPTSLDSYATMVDGTEILQVSPQNNVRDAIEAMQAKIGIDGSAVVSSHDYKIAQLEAKTVCTLTASGATVFNTTMSSPSSPQDLDLSAYVGSNTAIVWLEVYFTGTNGDFYNAKTKGFGTTTFADHTSAACQHGGCTVESDGTLCHSQMCLPTDSAAVIQHWFTDATTTITVKLIAYIKLA